MSFIELFLLSFFVRGIYTGTMISVLHSYLLSANNLSHIAICLPRIRVCFAAPRMPPSGGPLFASLLVSFLAVAGEPIMVKRSLVTLSVSRRINSKSLGIRNILQHDQLRAQASKSKSAAKVAGAMTRQVSSWPNPTSFLSV